MTTLALVTIGQAPRPDLTPELAAALAGWTVVEYGALDGLDADGIAALAPRPGEHALTSRLRDGTSVVFGHDHAVPLLAVAVARAEAEGADAGFVACSGAFPPIRHERPLFVAEHLAHAGVRGLLAGMGDGGGRLGVVRPLPEQVDDAYDHWRAGTGHRPAAVTAASPYTDRPETVAAAAAALAADCDLAVLDCIGFDEGMRRAAQAAAGIPVVTVRGVAARLLSSLA